MEDSIETQLADDISGNIMLERDFKCLRQIGKLNLNKICTTTEESHQEKKVQFKRSRKQTVTTGEDNDLITKYNSDNSIHSDKNDLLPDKDYPVVEIVGEQKQKKQEFVEMTRRIQSQEGAFNESIIQNEYSPSKQLVNMSNNQSEYVSINNEEMEEEISELALKLQDKFVQYLIQVINGEKELNAYKANLLDNADFDIVQCF